MSENAPNIKKAIQKNLKWRHFGCFAHTINLIVMDALKQLEPVCKVREKVRSIVGFFKSAASACKLQDIQKQQGSEPKKLLQEVMTRWNSTFYLYDSTVCRNRRSDMYLHGFHRS